MRELRHSIWALVSASAAILFLVFFGAGIVGYVGESESDRAATCLTDATSAGPLGAQAQSAGVICLVAAITAIVLARRALATEERSALAVLSLIMAAGTIVVGVLALAAFLISNYNACPAW